MKSVPSPRNKVFVEARDDQFALINLLVRSGIHFDKKGGAPAKFEIDEEDSSGGDAFVLRQMTHSVVTAAAQGALGYVIDADDSAVNRWSSICSRLEKAGVDLGTAEWPRDTNGCYPNGLIATAPGTATKIGVWVMPDNHGVGTLESFLSQMVPNQRAELFDFAKLQTNAARNHGAQFSDQNRQKAELACWLAWQESPGLPYGTAVRAKFFDTNPELCHRFVNWFRTLFQLRP